MKITIPPGITLEISASEVCYFHKHATMSFKKFVKELHESSEELTQKITKKEKK